MNKKIAFFTLLLIGTVVIIIASKNNEKRTPVESPKYRSISKTNFYLGKFKPIEMVKIQPKISGIIDSVYVEIGDKVNIDDKIAKLRIIPIPEVIERARKLLKLASVNLKQKQVNHNRNITLFKKGVIAKKELEQTELELNVARIEYTNAQNNFSIAKKGFSNNANESPNIVRSTINGEILNILVKKGVNVTERNTFNDGSTIAVIVNNGSFMYEFEVTETDISSVRKGDNFDITIKALNNTIVRAQIKELKPLIKEDNSFHYLANAILLDSAPNLKPGYTGLAEFVLQQKKEALSIKEKNIIYKNRKSFVELIDEEENTNEIEIETGVSDGIYTEVLSGIKKNDRIKLQ